MANLSDAQKANFLQNHTTLGFGPNEFSQFSATGTGKNVVVLSPDPSKATVPGKIIAVSSIAHLKQLIGNKDGVTDNHISYPPSLKSVAPNNLTNEHISNLKQIAHAYVFGNSQKIQASDVDMINATMFPGQIAVYSAENIVVSANEVYYFDAGTVVNAASFEVNAGGQVLVLGDSSLKTQTFTQDAQTGPNPTPTFTITPAPISPAQASTGGTGSTGGPGGTGIVGVNGYNGSSCTYTCKTPPGNGGQGGTGSIGGTGSTGLAGAPAITFAGDLGAVTGIIIINAGGQNGQVGGTGGTGGSGGSGGAAGPMDPQGVCTPASAGLQGNGGQGGTGGTGGKAGDGPLITITFRLIDQIPTMNIINGLGGAGGQGGTGGTGNTNGLGGVQGSSGVSGAPPVLTVKQATS